MNSTQLPRHIAIIMDGNGRWAKQRYMPRVAGHKAGLEAAKKTVEYCVKKNIEVLSLFVFSSENWRRPQDEVSYLMDLFAGMLQRDAKKLHEQNVQLRIIGDRSLFSAKLQQHILDAEQMTAQNTGLKLLLATSYGGQWDILQATRQIAHAVRDGLIEEKEITSDLFKQYLSFPDLPDPDLFIRTSGETRVSNFMLWQIAYAELYFTPVFWPDFDEHELDKALNFFATRERRFGHITEQLKEEQHA